MSATPTAPLQDPKSERKSIERKREWAHGDHDSPDYPSYKSQGKTCDRYNRPIYTDPQKTPSVCHSGSCSNDEWYSKGIVHRVKGTHGPESQIVHREK